MKLPKNKVLYRVDDAVRLIFTNKHDNDVRNIGLSINLNSKKKIQLHTKVQLPHSEFLKEPKIFYMGNVQKLGKIETSLLLQLDSKEMVDYILNNLDTKITHFICTPETSTELPKIQNFLKRNKIKVSPKNKNITNNPESEIQNILERHLVIKSDKNNVINCIVGNTTLSEKKLKNNIVAIIEMLSKYKDRNNSPVAITTCYIYRSGAKSIPITLI